MKRTIMFTLILVPCLISKSILNGYLPNLPVGEYKVYARAVIKCKPTTEGTIVPNRSFRTIVDANLYVYKISSNTSEIRGNVTIKKPIYDSFNVHFSLAVKDSIGGWKENVYFCQTVKVCTQTLHLLGSAVSIIENNFDSNWTCPLRSGVFVSKGLDVTSLVSKANIPKQFFYGTYKMRIELNDNKKKQVGCTTMILDVKRPWETSL